MQDRFTARAQQVVSRARDEARLLEHPQVGTEHLLLGLVADESGAVSRVLRESGITLDVCRGKVREAVGPATSTRATTATTATPATPGGTPASSTLPLSDRAERTLERADRLSIRRHDPQVEPEHIALSVLDVEGRAGQVLRGLSVDLALVRDTAVAALEARAEVVADPVVPAPVEAPPRCAACGAPLEATLAHRRLTARAAGDTGATGAAGDAGNQRVAVIVVYCSACGATVGAATAR